MGHSYHGLGIATGKGVQTGMTFLRSVSWISDIVLAVSRVGAPLGIIPSRCLVVFSNNWTLGTTRGMKSVINLSCDIVSNTNNNTSMTKLSHLRTKECHRPLQPPQRRFERLVVRWGLSNHRRQLRQRNVSLNA